MNRWRQPFATQPVGYWIVYCTMNWSPVRFVDLSQLITVLECENRASLIIFNAVFWRQTYSMPIQQTVPSPISSRHNSSHLLPQSKWRKRRMEREVFIPYLWWNWIKIRQSRWWPVQCVWCIAKRESEVGYKDHKDRQKEQENNGHLLEVMLTGSVGGETYNGTRDTTTLTVMVVDAAAQSPTNFLIRSALDRETTCGNVDPQRKSANLTLKEDWAP